MTEPAGELSPLLAGAVVQRVDVAPDAVVLRVRLPGETVWVILAGGAARGVGLARGKRPRAAGVVARGAALHDKLRWRAHLEGARVERVDAKRVVLRKAEHRVAVELPARSGASITLRDVALEEHFDEPPMPEAALEALCARGDTLAADLAGGAFEAARGELGRAARRAIQHIDRRIAAVKGDLARIEEASALAAKASLFVAAAAGAPRGARSLQVIDWSTGEPRDAQIPLDPSRPAREQIEAMFRRSRRLKLGAGIANRRLAEAESAHGRLSAVEPAIGAAETLAQLETLAKEARAAAPRDFAFGSGAAASFGGRATPSGGRRPPRSGAADVDRRPASGGAATALRPAPTALKGSRPHPPHRTFRGAGGGRILVGRGAAHNDAVTFRIARPHDLWLHAKGQTGAHVVVPLEKNVVCPGDLLVEAAHLAAHFSAARAEKVVEVQYTPRRYLRKPRGSAPGEVVVDREKVLVLRLDADLLAKLLEAEEPAR